MCPRGRQRRRLAAAAMVAGLCLAACGGDDATAPPSSAATSAGATTLVTTGSTAAGTALTTGPAASTTARGSTVVPPTSTTLPPATASVTPATAVVPSPDLSVPASLPGGPAGTIEELLALGRPLVLAHTGGEDAYPGSTMFAFGESVRAGVDVLDLNVVLSADGVLMVQHDTTVDRLTDGTGAVGSMTAEQLQTLDNAHWFTADGVGRDHPDDAYVYRGVRTGVRPAPAGYAPDDFTIPRLDEVIARFPDVPLNVEIKGDGDAAGAAAVALADLLRATGREDATVVTSFDDATVAAFHAGAPQVEISPGLDASTAFVLAGTPLPDGMRILQLPPEYQGIEVLSPATVAAAHAAGYVIWVWPNVAETPELYDDLLAQGMDALNANDPIEAVLAVRRFLAAA